MSDEFYEIPRTNQAWYEGSDDDLITPVYNPALRPR